MRHGIAGNKLGRKTAHRKATVRDIAKATLIRQRICTTKAKAKEAKKLVDKLITMGKKGTLAQKRRVFSILCDHKLVSDLFSTIAPRFSSRNGGYTRIIPLGNRRGDNAQLVYLELTEKAEIIVSKPKTKKTQKVKPVETKPVEAEKEETKVVEAEAKETEDVEKVSVKKEEPKVQHKKTVAPRETKVKGKHFMGGIRKIFNKKKDK